MCAVTSAIAAVEWCPLQFSGRCDSHRVRYKHCCIKLISKAFALFCRKFGNVVNRAFLVKFFWVKNPVGATFYAFCNYGFTRLVMLNSCSIQLSIFSVSKPDGAPVGGSSTLWPLSSPVSQAG